MGLRKALRVNGYLPAVGCDGFLPISSQAEPRSYLDRTSVQRQKREEGTDFAIGGGLGRNGNENEVKGEEWEDRRKGKSVWDWVFGEGFGWQRLGPRGWLQIRSLVSAERNTTGDL